MVYLDIYFVDITLLNNYTLQELFLLTMWNEKNNIVDLLIKGLNRELAEKSSKGIRLNPIEWKVYYTKENPT